MTASLAPQPHFFASTANDRLKERFGAWFWRSLLAAAALHFVVLSFWPAMPVSAIAAPAPPVAILDVIPPVEVPPPPERIARPVVPMLSTRLDLDEEITIPPTTWADQPLQALPQPPTREGVNVEENPIFTPFEVRPELRNRTEFGRLLERAYPPTLRDAGIGGTVVLWVFIDEQGNVRNTRVVESAGYEQLDRVAEEVMRQARFSPALNRDQRVAVWIQLPVTFQSR